MNSAIKSGKSLRQRPNPTPTQAHWRRHVADPSAPSWGPEAPVSPEKCTHTRKTTAINERPPDALGSRPFSNCRNWKHRPQRNQNRIQLVHTRNCTRWRVAVNSDISSRLRRAEKTAPAGRNNRSTPDQNVVTWRCKTCQQRARQTRKRASAWSEILHEGEKSQPTHLKARDGGGGENGVDPAPKNNIGPQPSISHDHG